MAPRKKETVEQEAAPDVNQILGIEGNESVTPIVDDQPPGYDPEAPLGRFPEGHPLAGQPRKRRPRGSGGAPKIGSPSGMQRDTAKRSNYAQKMTALHGIVGGALTVSSQADGAVILGHAEALGNAWADVAMQYPKVAEAIDKMAGGAVIGTLVMLYAQVTLQIMANHGKAPAFLASAPNLKVV